MGPPFPAPEQASGAFPSTLLVDGHVHLHECFRLPVFLDRAWENLAEGASRAGFPRGWLGVLLFTESSGTDRFTELAGLADLGTRVGGWVFSPAGDGIAVAARSGDRRIVIVAGRQVATDSRLEVLALCTPRSFDDGRPLRETIGEVMDSGGVPVVPWGFGKWWFRRGRILQELLDETSPGRLLLGDNGGRPRLSRRPRLFPAAEARGIGFLAGSDPLPFPAQERRVGSYGSVLPGDGFDWDRPGLDVRRRLLGMRGPVPTFGRRVGLGSFAWGQLRLRLPGRDCEPEAGQPDGSPHTNASERRRRK